MASGRWFLRYPIMRIPLPSPRAPKREILPSWTSVLPPQENSAERRVHRQAELTLHLLGAAPGTTEAFPTKS